MLALSSRLSVALAGLAAYFVAGAEVSARQKSLAPSAAPAEWVSYAEAATGEITGWLRDDSPASTRLRDYFARSRATSSGPTPPLVVKVWIRRDGRVTRIGFAPFADDQANGDLRTAITGRQLATAPPKGMLLPLNLAIQLDLAEAP